MSLKCSVLGHAFDDGVIEREREEQGSEVVSTVRETETCTRCGTERVVSENTEVTTLETPSDIVGDDLSEADVGDGEAGSGSPDPTGQGGAVGGPGSDTADGSGVAPTPPAETGAAGSDTASSPATPEADVAADPDPEADDAVILGEEETDERAPGEWPEERSTGGEEHTVATGAVAEWPEEDDEDGDDWAPETDSEPSVEVEPTSTAVTVPEGSFHCPECGFSTPVDGSSLRAGDFCPECHRGSLDHRS